MSFDADFGWYTGHQADPRTPEEPDRYTWEIDNPVTNWMDGSDIEDILYKLLHGNADEARRDLDGAIEARFHQWIDGQAQQDEEDAARDRYEERYAA